jgi:alpha-beta hydrolase superfamily lysophospholipase
MLIALALAVVALAAIYLAGPRVEADTTIRFDPSTIGANVDAWLAEREAAVPGIRPGLEKEIIWAREPGERTPLAIIYIHGFSASKGELRPLPDLVAGKLGANLFYTRLTGHGRDGKAMAEASVNAWINDLAEAVAVGRRIGDRLVVMAMSTGGGLVTWAAANTDLLDDAAGIILFSPNYGVQAAGSGLLTGPWGLQIAKLAVGAERGFEPQNELQAELWTTRYPTEALLPMAKITEMAASAPVETIKVPALFLFSDRDSVVRPDRTREIAARWGAPAAMHIVEDSADPSQHAVAGDAYSPGTTEAIAAVVTAWIDALPG